MSRVGIYLAFILIAISIGCSQSQAPNNEIAAITRTCQDRISKLTGNDEKAEAYYECGWLCINNSSYNEARGYLDKAIKLKRDARFFIGRSLSYSLQWNYDDAIADANVARRLSPDNWQGLVALAIAHQRAGEHKKAIASIDKAIKKKRGEPGLYLIRALSKRYLGDEIGYKSDIELAMQMGFKPAFDAWAANNLMDCLHTNGTKCLFGLF